MLTMTQESHESVDPDRTCPRCLKLKARMTAAAETADAFTVTRYGKPIRGSQAWKNAYYAALSS